MLYIYKASNAEGAMTEGEMDAPQKGVVIEHLSRKGLIPVMIEEKMSLKEGRLQMSFFDSVNDVDVITITRNLSATIKAGLSVIEGLNILIVDTVKKSVRNILTEARLNTENGKPLSMTFGAYPRIFPPVFIGMLRAGEMSGKMSETLMDLSRYLSKEYSLRKKIKGALTYPVILLIGSVSVVALLLIFVLPRLAKTFTQTGVSLPPITKALIAASDAITNHFLLWGILLFVSILFFIYMRKTSWGRRLLVKVAFMIPVAQGIVMRVALVRFARTLGALIGSGLSITESLDLVAASVGNPVYEEIIREAADKITKGIPLSQTFEQYQKYFPRFLTSLIGVGEKTGTLEHILITFAEFMDEEVENTVKNLTTIIEPVLLLFMGLFIGLVALAILLPIYQLVGKFV